MTPGSHADRWAAAVLVEADLDARNRRAFAAAARRLPVPKEPTRG